MRADFQHIQRFWDHTHDIEAARILPGEYYVTDNEQVIVTVLGSCISACIRDPMSGIGGMNHFLLPVEPSSAHTHTDASARYGIHAMEMLINELLKRGARRSRLEVKLSGGAHVLDSVSGAQVGMQNIEFVRWFLDSENLSITAEDVGGQTARKVYYFPQTGRMRVRKMIQKSDQPAVVREEAQYMATLKRAPVSGEVELF